MKEAALLWAAEKLLRLATKYVRKRLGKGKPRKTKRREDSLSAAMSELAGIGVDDEKKKAPSIVRLELRDAGEDS